MLYLFRLLLLLINIDQETVLNWFGVDSPNDLSILNANINLPNQAITSSTSVSLETLRLIVDGLWQRVQEGLTLADIETILFFILFVRFIILAIRYNLKTSLYITCIGLFAGYLWYRHLIDLIGMYRSILIKLPYLHKLGIDAIQLRSMSRQMVLTDLKLSAVSTKLFSITGIFFWFRISFVVTLLNRYVFSDGSLFVSSFIVTNFARHISS